jgi:ferredoxin
MRDKKVAFVQVSKCIGCGACISACRDNAISFTANAVAQVNPQKCTGCRICTNTCQTGAISMVEKDKSLSKTVLKFAIGATIKILSKIEKSL